MEQLKTKIIKTRITQEEYEKTIKCAEEQNLSISELLRQNLLSPHQINPLYTASTHDFLWRIIRFRDQLASQRDKTEEYKDIIKEFDKEVVYLWHILNSPQNNI